MTIEDNAAALADFRRDLIERGFIHAAAGELVDPSKRVWVRTTYTGGEYEIMCWLKPEGSTVQDPSTRFVVRSHLADLGALADSLDRAAFTDDATWPCYSGPGLRGE